MFSVKPDVITMSHIFARASPNKIRNYSLKLKGENFSKLYNEVSRIPYPTDIHPHELQQPFNECLPLSLLISPIPEVRAHG